MKKIIFLISILVFYQSLFSQQRDLIDKTKTEQQTSTSFKINADAPELFGKISDANIHTKTVPVEDVVKKDKYIVGPNDLFNLGLYGYVNQQIPIYVNLEGSVIIPTVGEIPVAGLKLSQAKEIVISAVKKRYYSSDVSFTLTMPRTFVVKISGLVEGNYEVTSTMRPTDLLSRIIADTTNISRVQYEKTNTQDLLLTNYSLRNIQLIRKDGSVWKIDMYKFYMTGDDSYNPFFVEGDIMKIPFLMMSKNFITINGAVQLGGTYEYSPDDNLETVIGLGRGFDVNANKDSIVIYRSDENFKKFETIYLSYTENKNYKIQNFDRVFVKFNTDYQKNLNVVVIGEVNREGVYPITFKNTRLKEIIEMAGGLKKTAFLPLCILFRQYDKEYLIRDTSEIFLNMRANDLIVKEMDIKNFERDIMSRRNRVVVDFEKLFLNNDESQNVILEDKDVIYINDDKKIVYVYGQVNNEGYVPYKKGMDYEYYINQAGGYTLAADKGNSRIIRFNSRGWYKPDTDVLSGDFIYVPKTVNEPFSNIITIVSQIASVILGVLTTYLLFRQNK